MPRACALVGYLALAGCSTPQLGGLVTRGDSGVIDAGPDAGPDAGSCADKQRPLDGGPAICLVDAGGCAVYVSVDLTSDVQNCGGCGNTCGDQQSCVDAGCQCDNGLLCDGGCMPPDDSNCGGCGVRCEAGSHCLDLPNQEQGCRSLCDQSLCVSPLETCNPDTGDCLCGPIPDGGPLPPQCSRGFFCASFDGGTPPQCFQPCDPYAENCPALAPADGGLPDASVIQACYYEAAMNALVCEPILEAGYEGLACNTNSDCPVDPYSGGLACFPLTQEEIDAGNVRACRYYCDNFDGGPHPCPGCSHCGPPVRTCVPLAIVDAGGTLIAVGACQP